MAWLITAAPFSHSQVIGTTFKHSRQGDAADKWTTSGHSRQVDTHTASAAELAFDAIGLSAALSAAVAFTFSLTTRDEREKVGYIGVGSDVS